MTPVKVTDKYIGDGYPTCIVGEFGTNHGGNIDAAMRLITMAKEAGCDMVKGQIRTPELAVPEAEWDEVRETPFGTMTKLAYRRKVEFSEDQWGRLLLHAKRVGIPLFASVWDIPSVTMAVRLDMPCLKVPSARLHDRDLLSAVAFEGRPVILSTGMSTMDDVVEAVVTFDSERDENDDLILMQCTSAYPAKAEESDLRVIQTYKQEFGVPVGFSSHKIGKATCVYAVCAGANMIERHVTEDRRAKGSDHKMSTEADELATLVREIRYAEACLGNGVKKVWPCEEKERARLRGGIAHATR